MRAYTLNVNQLASGRASGGMEHYHDAVAEHTVPFVGIEPGARCFLPLAENPSSERLAIDPDMTQPVAGMRRAVEQPIP